MGSRCKIGDGSKLNNVLVMRGVDIRSISTAAPSTRGSIDTIATESRHGLRAEQSWHGLRAEQSRVLLERLAGNHEEESSPKVAGAVGADAGMDAAMRRRGVWRHAYRRIGVFFGRDPAANT